MWGDAAVMTVVVGHIASAAWLALSLLVVVLLAAAGRL